MTSFHFISVYLISKREINSARNLIVGVSANHFATFGMKKANLKKKGMLISKPNLRGFVKREHDLSNFAFMKKAIWWR